MGDSPAEVKKAYRGTLPHMGTVLMALSLVLMVAGIVIPLTMTGAKVEVRDSSGVVSGFTVGEDQATPEAKPSPLAEWSPQIFRAGFSFFVAFAVAFALRSFMKMAVIALGFFALALFGLQYAGLVEVKWGLMEARYDEVSAQVTEQAKSAAAIMAGYLPSAASAMLGLTAGFWRRGV